MFPQTQISPFNATRPLTSEDTQTPLRYVVHDRDVSRVTGPALRRRCLVSVNQGGEVFLKGNYKEDAEQKRRIRVVQNLRTQTSAGGSTRPSGFLIRSIRGHKSHLVRGSDGWHGGRATDQRHGGRHPRLIWDAEQFPIKYCGSGGWVTCVECNVFQGGGGRGGRRCKSGKDRPSLKKVSYMMSRRCTTLDATRHFPVLLDLPHMYVWQRAQ